MLIAVGYVLELFLTLHKPLYITIKLGQNLQSFIMACIVFIICTVCGSFLGYWST